MSAPDTLLDPALIGVAAPALRVSGTYIGSPVGGLRWRKAELSCLPMTKAHEYASVVQFEQTQAAPVRVSPSQRYEILTDTVRDLRQHVPGLEFIGVRLYGSDFDVQLSAELLAPDVLVTHAPLQLLPTLLQAGRRNIAIVEQDLRADGLEQGGNEFAVWLFAAEPDAAAGFGVYARRSAFLQGLARLELDRHARLPDKRQRPTAP